MTTPADNPSVSPAERAWNAAFFLLSAAIFASGLLAFSAGRYAAGLGDLGVTVLMFGMAVQFPFVRAFVTTGADGSDPAAKREKVLKTAEELRARHPWTDQASRIGWILLGGSLVLRLFGVE
ncbi:MAG: hypothetical protein RR101_04600 [Burkholderiaceae bacterium]